MKFLNEMDAACDFAMSEIQIAHQAIVRAVSADETALLVSRASQAIKEMDRVHCMFEYKNPIQTSVDTPQTDNHATGQSEKNSHHVNAKRSSAKAAFTALLKKCKPDPIIEQLRQIDRALLLLAPVATDGLIFEMVVRLASSRPEICGCLDDIHGNKQLPQHDRDLAQALKNYMSCMSLTTFGSACIGCHPERCSKFGRNTGGRS